MGETEGGYHPGEQSFMIESTEEEKADLEKRIQELEKALKDPAIAAEVKAKYEEELRMAIDAQNTMRSV